MSNLNLNTIQDRAAHIMKCFGQDINIQKGGPGSGRPKKESYEDSKTIGKTTSGKDIYHYHDHPKHKDFDISDHMDAAYLHHSAGKTPEEKEFHSRQFYKHRNHYYNPEGKRTK